MVEMCVSLSNDFATLTVWNTGTDTHGRPDHHGRGLEWLTERLSAFGATLRYHSVTDPPWTFAVEVTWMLS
jgi:signal transduction histidine kinase